MDMRPSAERADKGGGEDRKGVDSLQQAEQSERVELIPKLRELIFCYVNLTNKHVAPIKGYKGREITIKTFEFLAAKLESFDFETLDELTDYLVKNFTPIAKTNTNLSVSRETKILDVALCCQYYLIDDLKQFKYVERLVLSKEKYRISQEDSSKPKILRNQNTYVQDVEGGFYRKLSIESKEAPVRRKKPVQGQALKTLNTLQETIDYKTALAFTSSTGYREEVVGTNSIYAPQASTVPVEVYSQTLTVTPVKARKPKARVPGFRHVPSFEVTTTNTPPNYYLAHTLPSLSYTEGLALKKMHEEFDSAFFTYLAGLVKLLKAQHIEFISTVRSSGRSLFIDCEIVERVKKTNEFLSKIVTVTSLQHLDEILSSSEIVIERTDLETIFQKLASHRLSAEKATNNLFEAQKLYREAEERAFKLEEESKQVHGLTEEIYRLFPGISREEKKQILLTTAAFYGFDDLELQELPAQEILKSQDKKVFKPTLPIPQEVTKRPERRTLLPSALHRVAIAGIAALTFLYPWQQQSGGNNRVREALLGQPQQAQVTPLDVKPLSSPPQLPERWVGVSDKHQQPTIVQQLPVTTTQIANTTSLPLMNPSNPARLVALVTRTTGGVGGSAFDQTNRPEPQQPTTQPLPQASVPAQVKVEKRVESVVTTPTVVKDTTQTPPTQTKTAVPIETTQPQLIESNPAMVTTNGAPVVTNEPDFEVIWSIDGNAEAGEGDAVEVIGHELPLSPGLSEYAVEVNQNSEPQMLSVSVPAPIESNVEVIASELDPIQTVQLPQPSPTEEVAISAQQPELGVSVPPQDISEISDKMSYWDLFVLKFNSADSPVVQATLIEEVHAKFGVPFDVRALVAITNDPDKSYAQVREELVSVISSLGN